MTEILGTPGPSPIPPEALKALGEPVLHHRTGAFEETLAEVSQALKTVFQTKNEVLIHSASGTGTMEAAIVNLHSPGDKVICLTAGKFGERWLQIARAYGLEVLALEAPWGESPAPEDLEKLLAAHPGVKSFFMQACETSTGQSHPIKEYALLAQQAGALVVVDAIAAVGAYDIPTDSLGIDVLIGGSQKALMAPTGLSFASVSERAWRAYEKATLPRYYFDWGPERTSQKKKQTRFSSSVSLIKALAESLKIITSKGLTEHFDQISERAQRASDFAKFLGLKIFPTLPAPSLTVVEVPESVDGAALRAHIEKHHQVVFAGGQDQLLGRVIRWGHMGHQTLKDQIQMATALAAGLEHFGATLPSEWRKRLKTLERSHGA